VAAVKGPEIATRMVEELRADVRVLLSAGGQNFWDKSREYDPRAWERMREHLAGSCSANGDDGSKSLIVHGKQGGRESFRFGRPSP